MSRLLESVSVDEPGTCEGGDSRANNGANNGLQNNGGTVKAGEPMPDDLRRVVNRWADLPEPIRAAVLAIVEASR